MAPAPEDLVAGSAGDGRRPSPAGDGTYDLTAPPGAERGAPGDQRVRSLKRLSIGLAVAFAVVAGAWLARPAADAPATPATGAGDGPADAAGAPGERPVEGAGVGKVIDLTLPALDGAGTVELGAAGGPAATPSIVNVFASWCVPCREELPLLAAAADRLEGEVRFFGVDHQDSRESAVELLEETGAGSIPAAYDPKGTFVSSLGLPRALPITMAVAPDGTVLDVHFGELTQRSLDDLLAALR